MPQNESPGQAAKRARLAQAAERMSDRQPADATAVKPVDKPRLTDRADLLQIDGVKAKVPADATMSQLAKRRKSKP